MLIMIASLALTGAAIYFGYYLSGALQKNKFLATPVNWSIEHIGSLRVMIIVGIILFPVNLFLASRRLVKELRQINAGLQEISAGRFGRVVKVRGKNELSAVAESMNQLSSEWNHYLAEITHGFDGIAKGQFDHSIPERNGKLGEVVLSINQMREQLKHSIAEERRAEKTKNDLITGVSHDLRTPLTSILGFLEVIEQDQYQDEVEMRYYVNIAYEKSLALRRLIDELFEYTRINNGMPLEMRELDLAGLLRQLAEEFVPATENAGMEIRLNIPKGEFKIDADGGLLVRAYENLIANAIRYGKTGKYIDIDVVQDEDILVVRIQNYGDPIPERDLPFIFDRFYRADSSRSKQTGGTGLGLAITKSIVEVHGGSITARSSRTSTSFETRFSMNSLAPAHAEITNRKNAENMMPPSLRDKIQIVSEETHYENGRNHLSLSEQEMTPKLSLRPRQQRLSQSRLVPVFMIALLVCAVTLFSVNSSFTSALMAKVYSIFEEDDSTQLPVSTDGMVVLSSKTDKGYTLFINDVMFDGYRLSFRYSVTHSDGIPQSQWVRPNFQLDSSIKQEFPGIRGTDSGFIRIDAKNGGIGYDFNGTTPPDKFMLKVNVLSIVLLDDSAQQHTLAGDWSFQIPVKKTHQRKPNGQSEPLWDALGLPQSADKANRLELK